MAINFLNNIDLNKNQIIEPVIHTETSAPGSPSGGQMYYNSTDGNLYVYDGVGTAWVDLTSQGAGSTNLGYTSSATNGIVTSSTGTDATIILVTPDTGTNLAGLMSPADKTKLNGIEAGAQVNVVDSVDETTPGTSTGTPIVVDPTTGDVLIKSMAYAGTTNVGHVPTGGSGTTFLKGDGTWATPTNTVTNAFTTHTVTDTDSGYTWAETGSAVADGTADTLTLVSGTAIDIDVDATNDAIRIAHADTSTITGTLGTSGIQSITIDGNGHVTAVTPATYNNYVHPNHTGHVTSTGDGATVLTVSAITGQTELASGLASTDELVLSDGGVIKRMDISVLEAYMESNLSDADTTYTLPVAAGAANTAVINLTAGGSGSGIADSVTFSGTTDEIEITETTGNNGTIQIGLPTNVVIAGNLTVNGSTTTISTNNLLVEDALIGLQSELTGANSNDIGFIFERGTSGNNGVFIWDRSAGEFALGTTTATPASTGDLTYTTGSLIANLSGNADTADKWSTARTVTYATGDVTGSFSIDGSANVSNVALTIANDSVTNGKLDNMAQSTIKGRAAGAGTGDPQDLTATQVRTIINVADGADNYGGWNLQVDSVNTTGGAEVGSAETVNFLSTTSENGGITITNPATNNIEFNVIQGTTSLRGALQLATNAETLAGSNTAKPITPANLAATKKVSTIVVASLSTPNAAVITHNLGTEDISVELFDATSGSTRSTVFAEVKRGDLSDADTTNKATILFGVIPTAITHIDVVIHSHGGATSVSPSYPTS